MADHASTNLSFYVGTAEEVSRSADLDSRFARIADLGYKAVEFMLTDHAAIDLAALLHSLDRSSLKVSAFLTGGIYVRHGVCFASPKVAVRKDAIRRVVDLMPL